MVHDMTNTSPTAKTVAATIINQLGDRCFIMMTGAKKFTFGTDKTGNDYLQFSLPKTANFVGNKADSVRITLLASDTYRMEFRKYHTAAQLTRQILKDGAASVKGYDEKGETTGIYAEDLRRIFTEFTGLETSLGRLAA